MTKYAAGLTTLLTTVLLSAASAQATTRFVTTGGSDAGNSCMGIPCRTIQHAIDQAAAGDTLLIGSGRFAEAVTVNKSLTITGAGSASPFVDASGTSSPAFTLGDANVTLTDMHVRGGVKPDRKGGVVVPAIQGGGASAPSITLDHVLADQANPTNPDKWDNALGFDNSAGSARLTVSDSEIDGYQAAIGVKAGAGGSLTVQRSRLTVPPFGGQPTFEGPFPDPQGDVISAVPVTITDSALTGYDPVTLKNVGATIARTTITGVGAGILLYDDGGGANVSVRDSVLEPQLGPSGVIPLGLIEGFAVVRTDPETTVPTLSFVGDTIAARSGVYTVGLALTEAAAGTHVTVANTALRTTSTANAPGTYAEDLRANPLHSTMLDWHVSHSAFTTVVGPGVPAPGSGTNLNVEPHFADLASNDLHLASSSPLFDRGDPNVVIPGETDVAGAPRTKDHGCNHSDAPDIGAYEAPGCPIAQAAQPVGVVGTVPPSLKLDTTPPLLTHSFLQYTRFAVYRDNHRHAHIHYGSTLTYAVSEQAKIVAVVQRTHHHAHGHPDTYTTVGTAVSRTVHIGSNWDQFNGTFHHHTLTPGDYRIALHATDAAGNRSLTRHLPFTIVQG